MKKLILVAVMAFVLPACALHPPSPPSCVDDGRGMVPINPKMITQEQRNAVYDKYREVKKETLTRGFYNDK